MSRYLLNCLPFFFFFTKLGIWYIITCGSVMQKYWVASVKVIMTVHIIKIWWCLLYLLNCWSFCYQTLTVHYHKPECIEEVGLLCLGSRSWQNFIMSCNVWPDGSFWITEPFSTKLCMVMHHQAWELGICMVMHHQAWELYAHRRVYTPVKSTARPKIYPVHPKALSKEKKNLKLFLC